MGFSLTSSVWPVSGQSPSVRHPGHLGCGCVGGKPKLRERGKEGVLPSSPAWAAGAPARPRGGGRLPASPDRPGRLRASGPQAGGPKARCPKSRGDTAQTRELQARRPPPRDKG
jgi:hypothetical protein